LAETDRTATTGWLHPPGEQQGLNRYLETLRERLWLVLLAVVITTGAAVLYVVTADRVYEAEADVLVNPVPDEAEVLVTLGLLRESVDPLRDVETASQLITNIEVAERAREELGTGESAESLLGDVEAKPVAESNIVSVTARRSSPELAADTANAFAQAAIDERTERLHDQIDTKIPALEAQARTDPTAALGKQISELRILRSGDDPTLQLETRATPPGSPVSPRPALSIVGGILAGLVLGTTAAFALQALDPRLRREEQLRAAYRLPILARIPRQKAPRRDAPVAPDRLTPEGLEAHRTLRATLAVSRIDGGGPRAALITSPSASEGKTTTAVNLAASLALAGRQVILIEADLRRPQIAGALGMTANRGIVNVLIEETPLEDALVSSDRYGPNLKFLLAERAGVWIAELFSLPAAQNLIERARQLADYVVIDSSPLTEVVDALPLAAAVDDVVIVVQLGKSRLKKIAELAELLAENGVKPAGFVVLGVPTPGRGYYYHREDLVAESASARELAERVRQ
jgi:capsular exopolysaccharide synthesis family protein